MPADCGLYPLIFKSLPTIPEFYCYGGRNKGIMKVTGGFFLQGLIFYLKGHYRVWVTCTVLTHEKNKTQHFLHFDKNGQMMKHVKSQILKQKGQMTKLYKYNLILSDAKDKESSSAAAPQPVRSQNNKDEYSCHPSRNLKPPSPLLPDWRSSPLWCSTTERLSPGYTAPDS